ncbi:MAG: 4-hydroxy-tetrahydrodipicolinate synthase [Cyclobacteriaceae bacterium]|nr:4-hydroxy-tetrahydrodipicolinate synthase [Cyclobacteriaceae bacterium]
MESLKGLGVALVTPFDVDEKIDFEALLKLLKYTATHGVDYWVVMGSTGEAITLSNEEQEEILQFVLKNNPNNLPIVFGLGGSNTAALLTRLQALDLSGVTAILSSSPAYNKPTQQGIIAHFKLLADNSPKPIILYNVPGRTCSNMEASTTLNLASHPNIVGIKEASGDLEQIKEIIEGVPDGFIITSGDDMLTPEITKLGGAGAISVLANALPAEFKQLVTASINKDENTSNHLVSKLQEINDLMYVEGNPTGLKELLSQQGVCSNNVRLPLVSATYNLQKSIKAATTNLRA